MKQNGAFISADLGQRAIVVGAGLSGMSAARVLSDYFEEVLILDQDELPDGSMARGGVPQGKHPHGLLCGGLKALENLFPGFGSELERAGAVPIDPTFDILYELPEQELWPRIKFDARTYAMSRPLIERTLRRQLERIDNVVMRAACRTMSIASDSEVGVATGVYCQTSAGSSEKVAADLIVDASGNGSLTLAFLRATGRSALKETKIGVSARYASALFGPLELTNDYKVVATYPNAPAECRGGLIIPAENGNFQVVLLARGKDLPPTNGDKFLGFARTLPTLHIYDAIRKAERLTEITPFHFPESRWRHFGQLADFPRGLLPIGDAICRFNPIYGQGMTSAVQQANLLSDVLATADSDPIGTLAPSFLPEAEKLIANPWAMSAMPDFVYADTTGERPPDLEDRLNFQHGLSQLATRDPEVFRLLIEVRHMLRPLAALDDPSIVERVKAEMALVV